MKDQAVSELVDYTFDHVRQFLYNVECDKNELPTSEEIEKLCCELYTKLCHQVGALTDEDIKYINECPTSRCFIVCATAEDRDTEVNIVIKSIEEEYPDTEATDGQIARVQNSESQLHLFQDAAKRHK
ncbi:MAG TPA: hypothetical protein DDX29_01235 [Clostridiales bacterium]|nr:hypothetical protein [Clostridiales bacterium]